MTFEDVQSSLYSKDLNERKEHKTSYVGKGLSVKGKFPKKDGRFEKKKKGKVLQNLYGGNASAIRCYHCKKKGHTREVCHDRLNNHGGKDKGNATIVQDDYELFDVLVVSSSNFIKEWITDLGCT